MMLKFASSVEFNLPVMTSSVIFCSIKFFIGFTQSQLLHRSWYQFVHHNDLQEAVSLHCRGWYSSKLTRAMISPCINHSREQGMSLACNKDLYITRQFCFQLIFSICLSASSYDMFKSLYHVIITNHTVRVMETPIM